MCLCWYIKEQPVIAIDSFELALLPISLTSEFQAFLLLRANQNNRTQIQ